jgi:hypothetical protein
MKIIRTLLLSMIILSLLSSLTGCDFIAKVLRDAADKVEQKDTEKLSQADEVSTLVANFSTETAQVTQQTLVFEIPTDTPQIITPVTETPYDPVKEITPSATMPPAPEEKVIRHMGLSFTIPAGLDYDVSVEEFQEVDDPNDVWPGEIAAAHLLFQLNAPDAPEHFHTAQIFVFPGNSFMTVYPYWQTGISELNLLRTSNDFSGYPPNEALPFPDIFNAGQMIHSQEKAIEFHNGSGIRYLTTYAQDYVAFATDVLFYAFFGLTDDYNYLVAAVIPIYRSPLPDSIDLIEDPDAFFKQYDEYVIQTANLLNQSPDSDFLPNLALLDKLFEGLVLNVQ